ncbi:MAG: hypothetical protein Q7T44_17095 [Parvibaculum sp.]|nr:hypothetical protein [Parvibaculum sp.]
MKHARDDALNKLEPLLVELRLFNLLSERKRGIFYWRGRAFLHFHEDSTGLYADLRADTDFVRYPVQGPTQQRTFLKAVRAAL